MKWEGREESGNVEDRRGMGKKAGIALGGGSLLVVIIAMLFGVDPQKLLQQLPQPQGQQQQDGGQPRPIDPAEERQAKFSKVIFGDTERIWTQEFAKIGKQYRIPTLVLYSDFVESACGGADSAVGPFYCPGDEKVYIDLSFYQDMERKLNAPGEFARAYVIAHEVGHHVQNLLGYSKIVNDARRSGNKTLANQMSVRLELQADYLAGVWARQADQKYKFLEKGDVETALNAAFEIGDDRLQKKAQGRVVPDSFTHGTSKQRMFWFKKGLDTGDVRGAAELFQREYNDL